MEGCVKVVVRARGSYGPVAIVGAGGDEVAEVEVVVVCGATENLLEVDVVDEDVEELDSTLMDVGVVYGHPAQMTPMVVKISLFWRSAISAPSSSGMRPAMTRSSTSTTMLAMSITGSLLSNRILKTC